MKKFFGKIVSFLSMFFVNLDQWIHEHVQPSIETLQRIKTIVENPLVDILTALIPTDADDKVRIWILNTLTKSIECLGIVKDIATQPDDLTKIKKLLQYIRKLSPEMQKALYMRLASTMAKISSGEENIKGHSVDLLTQMQYSKMVAGVEAKDLPETIYTAQEYKKQLYLNATTGKYE